MPAFLASVMASNIVWEKPPPPHELLIMFTFIFVAYWIDFTASSSEPEFN